MNSTKQRYRFFLVLLVIFIFCVIPVLAKTWNVFAKMSIAEIQEVFDLAGNGDRIQFHKGVYDFSSAEFCGPHPNYFGAITITDKSLRIRGLKGNLIKGAPSEMKDGIGVRGIIAFYIVNPGQDKDVIIEGLNFETFLMGICADSSVAGEYVRNLRNLTIKNCIFMDIHRNGIAISGLGGDLKLNNNTIYTYRIGLFLSWYTITPMGQPDGTSLEIYGNNIDIIGSEAYVTLPIYLDSAKKFDISSNEINGGRWSISVNRVIPSDSGSFRGFIKNNYVDNSLSTGIELWGGSFIKIENNIITKCKDNGIDLSPYLYPCESNEIINNQIEIDSLPLWDANTHAYGILTCGQNNIYRGNIITGTGSAAIFMWSSSLGVANNELFEYNQVLNFNYASGAAHYIFWENTFDNTVKESEGATYLNLGESSNQFIYE